MRALMTQKSSAVGMRNAILRNYLKVKNCSKFIIEVMLRKRLVLEIQKIQTNKTFMASKHLFTSRYNLMSFGAISLI